MKPKSTICFVLLIFLLNKLKKTKEMKQQVLLAQIDLYKSVSVLNGTLFFILFYFIFILRAGGGSTGRLEKETLFCLSISVFKK